MLWHDLIPITMVILGIVLFLYGANYYDPITGYAGLAWFFGGIIVEIVFRVYKCQSEKE